MQKFIKFNIDTTLDDMQIIEKAIFKGDTLTLQIKVFNNGVLADLSNQTVDLILKKFDGTVVEGVQKTISNGIITATLTEQATLSEGIVTGTLQITESSTSHLSTNIFTYIVLPSIADTVLEKSKDEINTLSDLLLTISNNENIINTYTNLINQAWNTTDSIKALADIQSYISNNLTQLDNKNATANSNISALENENNRADTNIPALKAENDNADDKLDKFKLYDPTNLIQQVQNNTSSLSDIVYNFNNFSITGDGTTYDSLALQNLFNYAKEHKLKKIVLPKATYRIQQRLNLYDDLEIDFSGSTLIWDSTGFYDANQRDLRRYGLINIHGSIDRNTDGTLQYANVTTFDEGSTESNVVVTVDSVSYFSEGDFVRIDLCTGHNASKTDKLYPELNVMAKVLKIDGLNITLDFEISAFDYSVASWTNSGSHETVNGTYESTYPPTIAGARLYKVTPIKNVTIKNLIIQDSQAYTSGTTDVNTCMCGISCLYAYNFNIENVQATGTKFPVVIARWCHSYNIYDIFTKNPADTIAGMGYAVQNVWSMYATCKRIKGSKMRHTVDWSGVINGVCEDCYDFNNSIDSGIAFHGMCEYNIRVVNCNARDFSFGHGITYFSCMMDSITLENCKGDISLGEIVNYLNNFIFRNHTGKVRYYFNLFNSIIEKSNLDFSTPDPTIISNGVTTFGGTRRSTSTKTVKILDSILNYKIVDFKWYDSVEHIGCKIFFSDVIGSSRIISTSNNSFKFKGCKFYNLGLLPIYGNELNDDSANPNKQEMNIIFEGNEFFKNDNTKQIIGRLIAPILIANCKLNVIVNGNIVAINKQAVAENVDSYAFGWFAHSNTFISTTTDYSNAEIFINYINNQLYSDNANGVGFYADTSPTAYTLKYNAKNNIIKNAVTFDVLDATNNIKY